MYSEGYVKNNVGRDRRPNVVILECSVCWWEGVRQGRWKGSEVGRWECSEVGKVGG